MMMGLASPIIWHLQAENQGKSVMHFENLRAGVDSSLSVKFWEPRVPRPVEDSGPISSARSRQRVNSTFVCLLSFLNPPQIQWCPLPGHCPDTATAAAAAAAAKLRQSCLTLCHPTDGSPTDSSVPGILQARTLEWVAISFSSAWKWKVKSESEVAQSSPTLSDAMDCSLPGSSIRGILQARVLEWGAINTALFWLFLIPCHTTLFCHMRL